MSPRAARRSADAAPPTWRTAATVAIVLHLFCLAIAVASNVGSGGSRVGYSLRKIPLSTQYLKLLGMDLAYDFDLGGTDPEQASHELKLIAAGRAADESYASLPGPEIAWRVRRQRYRDLALRVAEFDKFFEENADLRTMLPLAIAERWLKDLAAPQESYTLICSPTPAPRWAAAPEAMQAAFRKPTEAGAPSAARGKSEPELITIDLVWNPWSGHYEGGRRVSAALTSKVAKPQATASTSNDDAEAKP